MNDKTIISDVVKHRKADGINEIGAPLQGMVNSVLVAEGDIVEANSPLFVIEAMKMESTITSPKTGKVKKIYLGEKSLVEQDDLVIELEDLE